MVHRRDSSPHPVLKIHTHRIIGPRRAGKFKKTQTSQAIGGASLGTVSKPLRTMSILHRLYNRSQHDMLAQPLPPAYGLHLVALSEPITAAFTSPSRAIARSTSIAIAWSTQTVTDHSPHAIWSPHRASSVAKRQERTVLAPLARYKFFPPANSPTFCLLLLFSSLCLLA